MTQTQSLILENYLIEKYGFEKKYGSNSGYWLHKKIDHKFINDLILVVNAPISSKKNYNMKLSYNKKATFSDGWITCTSLFECDYDEKILKEIIDSFA